MRRSLLLLATLTLVACADDPVPADVSAPVDTRVDQAEEMPAGDDIVAPSAPFDVNTATAEQLATIPGVGERMTREFLEYRPYNSILQFRREIGKYVDDAQVAAYEEYLFVPIDRNASDVETLMQLPNTDAADAEELVNGRPYATELAFLEAWTARTGGDAAQASVYVRPAP